MIIKWVKEESDSSIASYSLRVKNAPGCAHADYSIEVFATGYCRLFRDGRWFGSTSSLKNAKAWVKKIMKLEPEKK